MKKAIAAGFALALGSMLSGCAGQTGDRLSDTENAEAAWRYAVETERYTEEYRD